MFPAHRVQIAVLAMLTAASAATAQVTAAPQPQTTPPAQVRTVPPGNDWSHGTTLNVFGGAAVTTNDRRCRGRRDGLGNEALVFAGRWRGVA